MDLIDLSNAKPHDNTTHLNEMNLIEVTDKPQMRYVNDNTTYFTNLVAQNADHPRKLLNTIKQFCDGCDSKSSIQITIMGLNKIATPLVTIKDVDNCTVLHWAATCGSNDKLIAVLLGAAGADIENFIFARNISGNTALHLVTISACEHQNAIRICKKTGENNKRYVTAYNNCKEIMRLLINAVGNRSIELIKVKNKQGRTARSLATGEIAQIIENYHVDDSLIAGCCPF